MKNKPICMILKKLTYFTFLIIASVHSQNNLEFNQTLNLNIAEAVTVPTGKTWKITSATHREIIIDGVGWPTLRKETYGGDVAMASNLPIWVSEGKTISWTATNYISVLEFNVVPISSSGASSSVGIGGTDGFSVSGVFNIELTNNISGYSYSLFGTITVPEGKIWKITKVSSFNIYSPSTHGYIIISGNQFYTRLDQHANPSPNVYLSAGVHEVYATSSDGNGSIEAVTINGIEYNSN